MSVPFNSEPGEHQRLGYERLPGWRPHEAREGFNLRHLQDFSSKQENPFLKVHNLLFLMKLKYIK